MRENIRHTQGFVRDVSRHTRAIAYKHVGHNTAFVRKQIRHTRRVWETGFEKLCLVLLCISLVSAAIHALTYAFLWTSHSRLTFTKATRVRLMLPALLFAQSGTAAGAWIG